MRLRSTANRQAGSSVREMTAQRPGQPTGKLGEHLVSAGYITPDDIQTVLTQQETKGTLFGETAVALNKITRQELEASLAEQAGFPLLSGSDERIDPLVFTAFSASHVSVGKVRAIRSKVMALVEEHIEANDGRGLVALVGIDAGQETAMLSANLAVACAQVGTPTLLVDCDVDNPTIDALFRVPNRSGLTSLLQTANADHAVQPTAVDRLWVVPTGPSSPSAAAYLHRQSFAELIDSWALPDALVIASVPNVDPDISNLGTMLRGFSAAVLVVRKDHTPIATIRKVIDELDARGVPIAGSVVT